MVKGSMMVKGLTKEQVCTTQGQGQQYEDGLREGREGLGGGGGENEEIGTA